MIAQELGGVLVLIQRGHALPEGKSGLGIITGHGGKDKSDMVGLALMTAGILQIGEVKACGGNGLTDRNGGIAYAQHTCQGAQGLHTVLLFHLGAHLLG